MYSQSIANTLENSNENLWLELIENTGEELKDVSASGRTRPWGQYKMKNERVVKLYEKARAQNLVIIKDTRMKQLSECADSLIYNIMENGKRKLAKASFCRFRLCPICCWRKSLKLYAQVTQITDTIMERQDGARFIFLTLTVRNVEGAELAEELDRLNKGWSYLTSKSRTFAPAKRLKATLLGFMRAVEVTYNKRQDTFHPHIHAILEVAPEYFQSKNYISRRKWAELWAQALKLDYVPSVDVRTIDNKAEAVAEMAKYPTKLDNVLNLRSEKKSVEVLAVVHNALQNRRLVTFGGDMQKTKQQLALDDIEQGDLTHVETDNEKQYNAVAQILFRYQVGRGVYIC
jgi:plasmid rolling circle replication initiator protein Rep